MINFGRIIDGILPRKKFVLDEYALRNAGINILIQDERWERLFSSVKKPAAIVKAEGAIHAFLDEKTRLNMEKNMIAAEKQVKLNRIVELTDKAVNENDEAARTEIDACEARVREINERDPQIEQRDEELDNEIKAANLAMLEDAALFLYRYMKKSQARVSELSTQISNMRETLKERISEREELDASVNETYQFLHGLFGAKQIESLDDHYT